MKLRLRFLFPLCGFLFAASAVLPATSAMAVPTVSVGNAGVLAGLAGTQHALVPVTLSAASGAAVTVGYGTSNGSATAGVDYTASSGTLTIPAGSTSGNVSIAVAGGQTDASGLTFGVTLSSPVNAVLGTDTGTVTIVHESAPTAVSVSPSAASSPALAPELLTATYASVGGAGNLSSVGLNLGHLSSAATSVYAKYESSSGLFFVADASGTYIGGYAAGSANTISTTLGSLNLAGTTVTENGNQLVIGWDFTPAASLIGTQDVYLIASDSYGLSSGWQNLGTWSVFTPTSASIGNVSILTGPSGTPHAIFPVTLSAPSPSVVSLSFSTSDGTATAGTDYTATGGTLNIPAGSTSGTILVPVASGLSDASGLTFNVTLSNPVNATVTAATGIATITHDAPPVAVSVTPNSASTAVGVSQLLTTTVSSVGGVPNLASVALNLGNLSSAATSLYAKYVPSSQLFYLANASGTYTGGYAAGSGNTITTGLGTLNLASTTVSQTGNQLIIGWDFTPAAGLTGTQNVSLIAADNFGLSSSWQNLGTWTIFPLTSASINNTTVVAGPSGNQHAIFTVSLSAATQMAVSVGYATADGTATAGTDYTATSGTLSIPAGSTSGAFAVPVASGQSDASGLTFTVTLTGPVDATIGTATGTATIIHDVAPSAVSVTPNPASSPAAAPELLTATYNSVGGVSNLAVASINLGKLTSPATSVYAKFVPSSQLFYVATASGTYIGGYAAGSANTISTPLATLNLAGTTVTVTGNQLVIGWDFTPSASLIGVQNVYLLTSDVFGLTSGWQNLGAWTITSAPLNDNFANAQAISGATGSVSGTTTGATIENGEPNPYGTNDTVWYAYTAPSSGTGVVVFTQSNSGVLINTYTGTSVTGLTFVTFGGQGAMFSTTAGTTYYLQVASTPANAGAFNLSWQWNAAPANDNFANAQTLSGDSGSVNGTTVGSTSESGEPNPGSGSTVWYVWTAPSGSLGQVTFAPAATGDTISVAAYIGTSLTGLTTVASAFNDANLVFSPTAGTTYAIQVENYYGTQVPFSLTWNWLAFPANDNFANAQVLSGVSGSVSGTTVGATDESGEPNPGSTVWYSWTAPTGALGNVTFVPNGATDPMSLAAFTGTSVSALTPIASGYNDASISFAPSSGTTYFIQAENYYSPQTTFTLGWSWSPLNDDFANAQAISGVTGSVPGTTNGSTVETNEPYEVGTQSVWYAYTAPSGSAGSVTLSLAGYSGTPTTDLYTGTSLTSVVRVASGNLAINYTTTPGATYYLQIQSTGGVGSDFTLDWNWTASGVPANDDFANAQSVSGTSGSAVGTTVGATVETSEPNLVGTSSVWYLYTAPASGPGSVTFTLTGYASNGSYIEGYSGSTLTGLTALNGEYGVTATFAVLPTNTYYIQVQSQGSATSNFTLNWAFTGAAANDDFANAQAISGSSGSVNGTNVGATVETDEPNVIGTSTVWYLYTAPSSSAGQITFTVSNYGGNACYLSSYSGTALTALTTITSVYGVTTTFAVTPGAQYYLQVQSQNNFTSSFTLGWSFVPAAANDDFANAQAVSGATGSVSGTTVGASVESGEPDLVGQSSVWYAYTAPGTGSVTFTVTNYGGSYFTQAYSGTSLTALTPVGGGYGDAATFSVTAGTVYYVQIQSQSTSTSAFTLGWTFASGSAFHPGSSASLEALPGVKRSGHSA